MWYLRRTIISLNSLTTKETGDRMHMFRAMQVDNSKMLLKLNKKIEGNAPEKSKVSLFCKYNLEFPLKSVEELNELEDAFIKIGRILKMR